MRIIGFNNLMNIGRTRDIIKVVSMTEKIYIILFDLEQLAREVNNTYCIRLTSLVNRFENLNDSCNTWMDKFFTH